MIYLLCIHYTRVIIRLSLSLVFFSQHWKKIPSLETLKTWSLGFDVDAKDYQEKMEKKRKLEQQLKCGKPGVVQKYEAASQEVEDIITQQSKKSGDVLRVKLDEIDDLIFPLLQWLIISNSSHIRILREEEKFSQ
jgi:hypothetical protein